MHVLIIGGTRFVGALLTYRLLARGDTVTLFNRGRIADPFGDRVERLRGDRTTPDLARSLAGRRFDAVVDFAAYTGEDARGAIEALGDRAGHYVFISTGQVYLVREGCPRPARELDYAGPVMPRPDEEAEIEPWTYGVDKRAAEDALAAAWTTARFPATRLRVPMINGESDPQRRLEGYLWRILDGGPVIVPDGGLATARHIYALDLAIAVARLLGDERTFGEAFNLCQDETPTVWELVGLLAERLGAPDRRVALPGAALGELPIKAISPFSSRWMSFLDPARARELLGFSHRPLGAYLDAVVASFLAHKSAEPPPGYEHREDERRLALATTLRAT
jgi:nucleoside-diphosphate-sugar epimerase